MAAPAGRTAPSAPRRPAPSSRAPARKRRRRGPRVSALAALAAAAVVAVALVGTLGGGGGRPARSSVHDQQAAVAKTTTARHSKAPAKPTASPKPPPTQTQTVTATSAAATTPPPSADTREAQGHQLMAQGNYTAAIPVLRQAIADASPNSLTYAYALYDLGRSLRLAGDPRQAVQVLWQRLQIPNQTGVVRQELQLALLALGQKANGGAAPAPGPAGAPGQQHGGPAGGPGPGPAQGGPGGGDQGD